MVDIESALRAYAPMMNRLDVAEIEPHLAEDFRYASQWVFAGISSKQAYLDYIRPKLAAVNASGVAVWAEMGRPPLELTGPCVVLAQGEKDNLVAVVLATVAGGKVTRLDICGAPSPWTPSSWPRPIAGKFGPHRAHPHSSRRRPITQP